MWSDLHIVHRECTACRQHDGKVNAKYGHAFRADQGPMMKVCIKGDEDAVYVLVSD